MQPANGRFAKSQTHTASATAFRPLCPRMTHRPESSRACVANAFCGRLFNRPSRPSSFEATRESFSPSSRQPTCESGPQQTLNKPSTSTRKRSSLWSDCSGSPLSVPTFSSGTPAARGPLQADSHRLVQHREDACRLTRLRSPVAVSRDGSLCPLLENREPAKDHSPTMRPVDQKASREAQNQDAARKWRSQPLADDPKAGSLTRHAIDISIGANRTPVRKGVPRFGVRKLRIRCPPARRPNDPKRPLEQPLTLQEDAGRHLGTNRDGSDGVGRCRAVLSGVERC